MKVLLRHCCTRKFYAGLHGWTDNVREAIDYQATDRAMDAAYDEALEGVEVLMHFDEPFLQIPMEILGFGRE